MKKIANVVEVAGEGLESLLGESVTLWCMNYIYNGTLEGVNDTFVKLVDAKVVYETGPFGDKNWKDAQPLPNACYIMINAIESFMILK